MKITDITKTKRGRYSVFVNQEFYGVLHPDVYFASSLAIGNTLSQEDLDELVGKSQYEIAKERALRLLAARSYTGKGLLDKLLPYAAPDIAQQVVDRMEDLGLIDDYDYARRYALDCLRLRGFSYHRTSYALTERGIDRQVAEKALQDLGEEDSDWLISQYLLSKYRRRIGDEEGERRTINAMLRRGHRYEDVRRVLDNLNETMEYYDNYPNPYED